MVEMPGGATVVLSAVVGSHAYGLAGPGSDVDRLGMFATPTLRLLGLEEPAESVVSSKPDVTFHEVGKATRLMLAGNPAVMELLWLPEVMYETRTPLGDEAIAIRASFLSAKRVRDAYLGYATQQFRKILNRQEAAATERAEGGDRRHAKNARHLMRLVDQGYDLYTSGTMTIRLAEPERYRDFGEKVAADPSAAAPFMDAAIARFDDARSALPAEPDRAVVEDWLLRVRKTFWVAA